MAATTAELIWLSYLLQDLHLTVQLPITLYYDNKSAQLLAANPCFHDRSKHFALDYHFTREKVQDGFLQTAYLPSRLQLADLLTKGLPPTQHASLASKLGLLQLEGGMKKSAGFATDSAAIVQRKSAGLATDSAATVQRKKPVATSR